MIAVGNALRRWREGHADLAGLGPDGGRVSFRLATDRDATSAPLPRSVLTISAQASETAAVVPYRCVEEITVSPSGSTETEDRQLDRIVDALVGALNGRPYLMDSEARLHMHAMDSLEFIADAGLVKGARITWYGAASWGP